MEKKEYVNFIEKLVEENKLEGDALKEANEMLAKNFREEVIDHYSEEKVVELENKISELENKINMINAQNQICKKNTNLIELLISLRDLNLITSEYTCKLSNFIFNHNLNEDVDRIKNLQAIVVMGISNVFENSEIRCSCNVEAVNCIVNSIEIKGFNTISPYYPWSCI